MRGGGGGGGVYDGRQLFSERQQYISKNQPIVHCEKLNQTVKC